MDIEVGRSYVNAAGAERLVVSVMGTVVVYEVIGHDGIPRRRMVSRYAFERWLQV